MGGLRGQWGRHVALTGGLTKELTPILAPYIPHTYDIRRGSLRPTIAVKDQRIDSVRKSRSARIVT